MNNIIPKIIFSRNSIIILILSLGILPIIIADGGLFLNGDMTSQMLPFVYETKRMLSSGIPLWSWNTALGDNFIGAYSYYTMYNPFTWINCLFPYKYIPIGFVVVLYLKFLVCGWTISLYLKNLGFGTKLVLLGSLLYSFSSWSITNLQYYMFLEPMMVFPLLLLAIDRYLKDRKYSGTLLIITSFLVIATNYYFAAGTFIAGVIYYFIKLSFSRNIVNAKFLITIKAFCFVAIGIFMAAFILLPVFHQLSGSPRQAIAKLTFNFWNIAERFIWLIYPKIYEGPFGYIKLESFWRSNTSSIMIFGLLPSLLLFKQNNYRWIKIYLCILVVLYLTPLNGIFVLFTSIVYTRWGYALTLAIIIATLYYFKQYRFITSKSVWIYVAIVGGLYFIFALLSILWHYNYDHSINISIVRICLQALIVALNLASLVWLCNQDYRERPWVVKSIVCICLCASTQIMAYTFYCNYYKLPLSHKNSDFDDSIYFREKQNIYSKESFKYRHDFIFNYLTPNCGNFANLCNMPSVEAYHSTLNPKLNDWDRFERDDEMLLRFSPQKNIESFDALMSVKKLVKFTDEETKSPIFKHGNFVNKIGMFSIYDYEYYLPMGFAYDYYQLKENLILEYENDRNQNFPLSMLNAIAIKQEDESALSRFMSKDQNKTVLNLDSLVKERRKYVCDYFEGDTKGFNAHINLNDDKVVFFSVISDKGFTATIDGKPTKIYDANLGLSAIVVPKGSHNMRFDYFTPGLKLGSILSILALIFTLIIFVFEKKNFNSCISHSA